MFVFIYKKCLDVNIWDAEKCFWLWIAKNVRFIYLYLYLLLFSDWVSIFFLCFIKCYRQWTFLQFICHGIDLYFVNCIINMITLINCTTLCYFYDVLIIWGHDSQQGSSFVVESKNHRVCINCNLMWSDLDF
jgi:hypothetical protein